MYKKYSKRREKERFAVMKDVSFSDKGAVYLSREAIGEIIKKYKGEEVGRVVNKIKESEGSLV